ncbi:MAG: hypothetical protein ACR2OO_10105 [Thermomicrobiales bacterium]
MSTSVAKSRWSALVSWAASERAEVIVESRGRPRAVIMAVEEHEELMALRERERRRDAIAELHKLAASIADRNSDLGADEIEALAHRFTREVAHDLYVAENGAASHEHRG